ncbi:uncharacterized protein TNCV_4238311 [Trichonephila clavipes]|nr:uncharacterized protein TNCV_4238311 [Trichonephila clavipes]
MLAADIYRQITEVYDTEAVSDNKVRKWEEGDDMLSGIVTGDETWVSHITPESKQQSIEWRHTSSLVKVKTKQTLSKRKIMATVFCDRRGVLLVDLMP